MMADPAKIPTTSAVYWRRVRRFTLALLCLWFFVTFGVVFFARELSEFTFFGWPLSYYMAAQGALFIYVAIVGGYAWRMSRLDRSLDDKDGDGK